jgi:hypothetical protein
MFRTGTYIEAVTELQALFSRPARTWAKEALPTLSEYPTNEEVH